MGTVGYALLEGMRPLEALYMTVITLSTVGFEEVRPLSDTGRLFTILLIVFGFGAVTYTVFTVSGLFIEGKIREAVERRRMERALAGLDNHVIVCGYGRLGRVVVEELEAAGVPILVLDRDEGVVEELDRRGLPVWQGDALDEESWAKAGVERARAVVLALGSEADAVFAALSLREAHPELPIHARATTEAGARRLRLAGVRQVVSPFRVGGQRIAQRILRPALVDFLDLSARPGGTDLGVEEVQVLEGSSVAGRALGELPRDALGALVVAIRRPDGSVAVTPRADDRLMPGDTVVLVGRTEDLRRFAELAAPPTNEPADGPAARSREED